MAFGDGEYDQSLRAAWQNFCQQLAAAGDQIFKAPNPSSELHRVDALRFLTQNLGQAFDLGFETKNPAYPALHAFCHPTRKLGGDAADFTYHQAWLSGEHCYRIFGRLGSARFVNFTIQGERPATVPGTDIPSLHDPFGDIPEANLFGHQLVTEPDGSFELFIGGDERAHNWLPTTAKTRKLFLRQGFDGWDETSAELIIERLHMTEPKPMPTAAELLDGIAWAGEFVQAVMADWPEHCYRYSPFVDEKLPNQFPPDPTSEVAQDDKKRGRAIANLYWELSADQALIIEFDAHDGFWMLANMGVFFNSFDYLYRPVSYTPSRTAVDSDGKIRFVLCAQDPGFHNWMDTQGFSKGNICYRNLLSNNNTRFATRLVNLADLTEAMPSDSKRVDSAERSEQMQQRFLGIRKRYRV